MDRKNPLSADTTCPVVRSRSDRPDFQAVLGAEVCNASAATADVDELGAHSDGTWAIAVTFMSAQACHALYAEGPYLRPNKNKNRTKIWLNGM